MACRRPRPRSCRQRKRADKRAQSWRDYRSCATSRRAPRSPARNFRDGTSRGIEHAGSNRANCSRAKNQPLDFAYSTDRLGCSQRIWPVWQHGHDNERERLLFQQRGFVRALITLYTAAGRRTGVWLFAIEHDFDTSAGSAPGQFLSAIYLGNIYATYSVTDAFYLNGIGLVGGGNNNFQRQIVLPIPSWVYPAIGSRPEASAVRSSE